MVEPEIHQHFFQFPVGNKSRGKILASFKSSLATRRGVRRRAGLHDATLEFRPGWLRGKQGGHLDLLVPIQGREQGRDLFPVAGSRRGHLVGIQQIFELRVAEARFLAPLFLARFLRFLTYPLFFEVLAYNSERFEAAQPKLVCVYRRRTI